MKKKILSFSALLFVVAFMFVATHAPYVKAASIYSTNLLKSVDLLGFSLLEAESFKFFLVDMDGATGDMVVNLPTLEGNDGLVYVIKRLGASEEVAYALPASGDKIEMMNTDWVLSNSGHFFILVADEENGTWWVVSEGSTNL